MFVDTTLLIFILSGLIIILLGWNTYLHIKLTRMLKGKDARTLEDTIHHAHGEISDLREFERQCIAYFGDIEKRLSRSVQAVETIRFNPFKGTGEGGNQSFSTALINERGDGVVVTSLYSRDRVSVFSKPLIKFKSEFELTDEEQGVVTGAKEKLGKK